MGPLKMNRTVAVQEKRVVTDTRCCPSFSETHLSTGTADNISDPRNTWNGPIVTGPDGTYHIYVPIYAVGSLSSPQSVLHGIATSVTGPWNWDAKPQISLGVSENPAFVVFKNETGQMVYSLWMDGHVRVADSPDGPFTGPSAWSYPGGNPAPIHHNGAFYMTNQGTNQVRGHRCVGLLSDSSFGYL